MAGGVIRESYWCNKGGLKKLKGKAGVVVEGARGDEKWLGCNKRSLVMYS
jgi:hypothetical protein